MHPHAKLYGGGERMFFVIMLQRTAVVEIVAQRGFQINAYQPRQNVFGTHARIHRQLPRALAEILLGQHVARDIKAVAVAVAQHLIAQTQGNAQIV